MLDYELVLDLVISWMNIEVEFMCCEGIFVVDCVGVFILVFLFFGFRDLCSWLVLVKRLVFIVILVYLSVKQM